MSKRYDVIHVPVEHDVLSTIEELRRQILKEHGLLLKGNGEVVMWVLTKAVKDVQ
jgi:hypothetical protein